MELLPFKENDYGQLIDWISSEKLNYLWGGPTYAYPLTHEQIAKHCSQPEANPFMFKVAGNNAGFIELFYVSGSYVAGTHYRIARVFIADAYKGQGLAKSLIKLILAKAETDFHCKTISLAVFDHNLVAKSCYQSLGFEVISTESGTRSFQGKKWDLLRMEKRLTD